MTTGDAVGSIVGFYLLSGWRFYENYDLAFPHLSMSGLKKTMVQSNEN